MLKYFLAVSMVVSILLLTAVSAHAQNVSAGTSSASLSNVQSLNANQSTSLVVSVIESFLNGLNTYSGGLIFTTPDFFTKTITLSDGSAFQGITRYRNIFYLLSVPVTALIILFSGGSEIANGQVYYIRQLLIRITVYIILFLFLVPFLSFSIQTENLLTSAILSPSGTQQNSITSFVTDYFTSATQAITSGQATAESLGIPNPNFFDLMQSITHVLLQIFLFLFVLLTLMVGICYIFMQFVVRFLSLLFLSIIFPLVIPFILSHRTDRVVSTFLRIWFTLLIHQPTFALGFMIVMLIVRGLLQQGPHLGILLIYTGSLFFLGTINILASKLFADAWVAAGMNLEAASISGLGSRLLERTGNFVGQHSGRLYKQDSSYNQPHEQTELPKRSPSVEQQSRQTLIKPLPSQGQYSKSSPQNESQPFKKSGAYITSFTNSGFSTAIVDKPKGIVTVGGKGFRYADKKYGLSYIYPTKEDALASGLTERDIEETNLPKRKYIDLSQFNNRENPHNALATQTAINAGKPSNYAHVTPRSDPQRIKHFLEITKEKNETLGIEGVLVKRFDNFGDQRSKRATTKIVSIESNT